MQDHALFQVILENVQDGVYLVDRDRRIEYWSPGAAQLSGFTPEQVVGRCCHDNILVHVDENGRNLCHDGCPLLQSMEQGVRLSGQVYMHHADGHRVPVHVRCAPLFGPDGIVVGAVETFSDATTEEAASERARLLEREALLDPLTGLPNRRHLDASLAGALARQEREGLGFGVLMLDIDHFKRVNDEHGHPVGDRVIRMVGRTLSRNIRPYDVAGRWGGEEFLILLHGIMPEGLLRLSERLRSLVSRSHLPEADLPVSVTVSIGATMARPGDTASGLLARADALLYFAKQAGRDRVAADPCERAAESHAG